VAAPGLPTAGRRPRGFTFVELIVVLAILAFAFTYAIIHLDGATGSARLSSAARQVGTTIEFLRGHAIQASRPLEMHIDLDRGEWRTVIPPRPSEAEKDRREEEEVLVTDPIALPKNIRFDAIQMDTTDARRGGELVIYFSPLGEVAPNGFLISLVSDDPSLGDEEAHFAIEVNGLTGEVSYTRGYGKFEQVIRGESF
jgi:prepilin-type N-terminal cleavage/methylation domain-containing protein